MQKQKTRKQILIASSDSNVNQKVKIQGTKFDRKWTIDQKVVEKMKWLKSCGLNTNQIATMCGVSWPVAKYHTDPEYRYTHNRMKNSKHYGERSGISERANYKRRLLRANAHVIYPMGEDD